MRALSLAISLTVLLLVGVENTSAFVILATGEVSVKSIEAWVYENLSDSTPAESAILDSLFAAGHFGASTSRSGDTLFVDSGNKYRMLPAAVTGDSALLSQPSLSALPWEHGTAFDNSSIESSAGELLDWCENNGYPYARVEIDSLSVDHAGGTVTPYIRVLAGPVIRIRFVRFQGNVIARPKLLERESRLRRGSLFSVNRTRQAQRRLAQLEYLKAVSPPRIIVDEQGETGLLFDVTENRLSRLDAVAGLSPKTESRAQSVTGLIDLQFLNLFGTGRRGKVFWQRPSSGVQELALSWREAWVAGSPLYVDGSFEQRVEDTVYVTRRYGVRIGLPVTSASEVFIGTAREELLADSLTALEVGLTTHQTQLFEIGLAFDSRDHVSNPRSGLRFETTAARGVRRTDDKPTGSDKTRFEQQRATVEFEANREIIPYWIAHGGIHARILSSDEPRIQVSDKYRVGGARSLRGYREEQFIGEQVAWSTLEARYWLGSASRFHMFSDWAAISGEHDSATGRTKETAFKGSYGVVLRLETGVGVWGVDYGISTGNSPLNGQLHVSLLSLF